MGGGWLSEISCTDSGDLARALGLDMQISFDEESSSSGTPSNAGADARRDIGGAVTVEAPENDSLKLLKYRQSVTNTSPLRESHK